MELGKDELSNMIIEAILSNPKLFCDICDKHYQTKNSYRFHMMYIHNFKIKELVLNNNEKYACNLCDDKFYSSPESLKQHYRYAHHHRANTSSIQDPFIDYIGLVCYSCNKDFKTKESLRSHIYRIHSNPLLTALTNDVTPSQQTLSSNNVNSTTGSKAIDSEKSTYDADLYCHLCDRKYKSRNSIMDHNRYKHNMTHRVKKEIVVKEKTDLPNISDPNFYCQSCARFYKSYLSYMHHLRRIHKMKLKAWNCRQKEKIRPNDKYYCDSCHYTYKHSKSFKYHVYSKHRDRPVAIITRGSSLQPDATPIMDDPHGYCLVCDRTFKSRIVYRKHVANTHHLSLESFRKTGGVTRLPIKQKQEMLTVKTTMTDFQNGKNKYHCPICLKTCRHKSHYRYHLFCQHGMSYSKTAEISKLSPFQAEIFFDIKNINF